MEELFNARFFLIPLIFTFLLPGAILFFTFIRRTRVDLVSFIVYVALFGFIFEFFVGFGLLGLHWLNITPKEKVLIISLVLLLVHSLIAWKIGRFSGQLPKIVISKLDLGVAGVVVLLVFLILAQMARLQPYFNLGTDQYFWFAYAERWLANPADIFMSWFRDLHPHNILNPQAFPLILAPFLGFFPKQIGLYQNFIAVWTIVFYILWSLSIVALLRTIRPVGAVAILAPLLVFLPYWSNYYVLSAGVVPQNLALFLFLVGIYLFYRSHVGRGKCENLFIIFFLIFFFLVHIGSWLIFVLTIGITEILAVVTRFLKEQFDKLTIGFLHIIDQNVSKIIIGVTLPVVLIAVIRYLLVFLNIIPSVDPLTTEYYKDVVGGISIIQQPYISSYLIIVQKIAIMVAPFVLLFSLFIGRSRILSALTVSWFLSLFFLSTPFLAYNALFASWQPFRYFLFLYPGMVVLTLLAVGYSVGVISHVISFRMTRVVIGFSALAVVFALLIKVYEQQKFVFSDMFEGSESREKKHYKEARESFLRVFTIAGAYPGKGIFSPVIYLYDGADPAYVFWAFAPRPVFIITPSCLMQRRCIGFDQLTSQKKDLAQLIKDATWLVVDKAALSNETLPPYLQESFVPYQESASQLFLKHL